MVGYVDKQLKSIIKKSGHYSIQGVYHVLTKAIKTLLVKTHAFYCIKHQKEK